jgi:hypothetical protein
MFMNQRQQPRLLLPGRLNLSLKRRRPGHHAVHLLPLGREAQESAGEQLGKVSHGLDSLLLAYQRYFGNGRRLVGVRAHQFLVGNAEIGETADYHHPGRNRFNGRQVRVAA